MTTRTILILILIISPALAAEIKIDDLSNSAGLLPFKLGSSKIIVKKHTFLHYIELDSLVEKINNLRLAYNTFNESIFNDTEYAFSSSLRNSYVSLESLLLEIEDKIKNIILNKPTNKRTKRGLLNIVGTINKWFTGSLDANDGEKYDNAIRILEKNQQKIVSETNTQITLFKKLVNEYGNSISTIVDNQQKISKYIERYSKIIENQTDNFYKYTMYLSVINQMFINSNVIITFLDNLENAITFSRLHTIHPDILGIDSLRQILQELTNYYPEREIIKLNLHDWYSIIKTNCYFSKKYLIFAIDIPLTHPDEFEYYHLYPIPSPQNSIIIPPKPYLALSPRNHQYMNHACEQINETFVCLQEQLVTSNEDCVISLITGENPKCRVTEIQVHNQIIEKVNEEYFILIPNKKLQIKTTCKEVKYKVIETPHLIWLPTGCKFEIDKIVYGNGKSNSKTQSLILPPIKWKSMEKDGNSFGKLHLRNVSLDEIHELQKHINSISPVVLEEITENHTSNLILWIFVGILTTILILYGITKYKYTSCPFIKQTTTKQDENLREARTMPTSVLYIPEVDS